MCLYVVRSSGWCLVVGFSLGFESCRFILVGGASLVATIPAFIVGCMLSRSCLKGGGGSPPAAALGPPRRGVCVFSGGGKRGVAGPHPRGLMLHEHLRTCVYRHDSRRAVRQEAAGHVLCPKVVLDE